jgi:arsenate reductase
MKKPESDGEGKIVSHELLSVLFVCIHNSARSQMAEAFARVLGDGRVTAESAGLEAGSLNPLVVESMAEIGMDIAGNRTKTVHDILRTGRAFDFVITVCDTGRAGECPVFPGPGRKLHWEFSDPSRFGGTRREILAQIRTIREEIRRAVKKFLSEVR